MNYLGGILLAVCAIVAVLCTPVFEEEVDVQWQVWKTNYNKRYTTDEEEQKRNNWLASNLAVEKHNAEESLGYHTYRLGINRFSDMTNDEFVNTMTMRMDKFRPRRERIRTRSGEKMRHNKSPKELAPPPYVDYRRDGRITSVKDQGLCLASYAFSAIGGVEALYYETQIKLVDLSAQNIIDCSSQQGDLGCSGGSPYNALFYMLDQGIENNTQYPYHSKGGKAGTCQFNQAYRQTQVASFVYYQNNDELFLQEDIATNGPMSACIDGSRPNFKNYKSGIYNDPSCSHTSNHCVLIVGYNATDTNNAYYIVKNSWGTQWGMEGYIYMSMFKDNQCGISSNYSYPGALVPRI